jgi:uncharacterized protein (DUF2141 family)
MLVCLLLAAGCSCRAGGESASALPTSSDSPVRADATVEPGPHVLVVTVKGIRNDTGQVLVSLFESEDGFPGEYAKARLCARHPASAGEAVVELQSVPAGRYAVAVLHDENGNEEVDTGFLGIPKEGAGVSNNPAPRMGPPAFEDAVFEYDGERMTLEVSLRYLTSQ